MNLISTQFRNALPRFARARKQAEALKLQPIPESEILAKLEKLKSDLPSAEEFEVTIISVPDASELRRSA